VLDDRVAARRHNFARYRELLADLPGVSFMPEAPYGRSNRWLSVVTVDPAAFGVDREAIRLALEAEDVESRPLWKPMHLQPLYADCRVLGGAVGAELFERGLCLPSGSAMSDDDLERVAALVRACRRS
jgi:dTDP-4-amino-4,6-dideoxygalactose transaminase